jgi:hypothetical protein
MIQKNWQSSFAFNLLMAMGFLCSLSSEIRAQIKPNEVVFTGGAALSYTQFGPDVFNGGSTGYNNGNLTHWSYPAYILNGDLGITDRLSLGAALSWQTIGINFNKIPYPYSYSYYQTGSPPQTWVDTYDRYNVSGRALYHFIREKELDMYLGVRIGYTWWDRKTTNNDPSYNYSLYDEYSKIFIMPLSIQSVLGFRYYFSDYVGLNAELGIGAPYALMLGLNLKFSN